MEKHELTLEKNILSTLAYFDLFDYPLTSFEIFRYLQEPATYAAVSSALEKMTTGQRIYQLNGFYSLHKDELLAIRRIRGNQAAKRLFTSAEKVGRLLYHFPFVRGIAISGSLSKNFADDRSDIDLFIITTANRLWIARTLLHILKKISYLFKKQDYFCMNYFVDEAALTIEEKNIYTATEVVTLVPLQGTDIFRKFYVQNTWTNSYLPNHSLKVSYLKRKDRLVWKKAAEFIFDRLGADQLNRMLMGITRKRWDKKSGSGRRNSRGILMGMNASIHCAKPDPANFQIWLLQQYEKKSAMIFQHATGHMKAVY